MQLSVFLFDVLLSWTIFLALSSVLIDIILGGDSWLLSLKGAKEGAEDELEPEELNGVQQSL